MKISSGSYTWGGGIFRSVLGKKVFVLGVKLEKGRKSGGDFSDIEFYSEKVSVKFTCIFLTKFCLCFRFQKQRKTLYEITKKSSWPNIGGGRGLWGIGFYNGKVRVKFTRIFLIKICSSLGIQKQRKTL